MDNNSVAQVGEEAPSRQGPTLYEVLQVGPEASSGEIAEAYRRQREIYDPDQAALLGLPSVEEAAERRKLVDEAHAVLGDPRRRFEYDRALGLVGDEVDDRRGISNREVMYAVGGVFIGFLILAALWSALGSREGSGPAVSEVNYAAPEWTLRTLDGGSFNLAEQRGKVVLVNFWGTWCEPCKEETPALQAAHEKLADQGLVIVGVDLFDLETTYDRGEDEVRQFINRYGVTYPIALDETGQVARDYRLYPIPVSYFIDRAGNVRYIRIGQLSTADVEAIFARL